MGSTVRRNGQRSICQDFVWLRDTSWLLVLEIPLSLRRVLMKFLAFCWAGDLLKGWAAFGLATVLLLILFPQLLSKCQRDASCDPAVLCWLLTVLSCHLIISKDILMLIVLLHGHMLFKFVFCYFLTPMGTASGSRELSYSLLLEPLMGCLGTPISEYFFM